MKKDLDDWEKTLLALYAGAVSGAGFNDVLAEELGIAPGKFGWVLYILQMRGLIEGCVFQPPHPGDQGQVMGVVRTGLMLTPRGFDRVEAMLEAQRDRGRLREVGRLLMDVGCSVMSDLIYGWMSAV